MKNAESSASGASLMPQVSCITAFIPFSIADRRVVA